MNLLNVQLVFSIYKGESCELAFTIRPLFCYCACRSNCVYVHASMGAYIICVSNLL